jgi:hypothetical protein
MRDHVPDRYYMVADSAFPQLLNEVANKTKSPLRQGLSCQLINKNERSLLHLHASLFHIIKLQSGACAPFKGLLVDSMFLSQLPVTKHIMI